ncbi:hypothetical protein SAY86_004971 [Trapa natans]|uniref:Transmembrane protein n=1 Tax=Trapa natans TaxID=22666 RepID=A0AAN7QV15_TRANT|nr:hypothetical protein SAY86_004971 [Trapa natans]
MNEKISGQSRTVKNSKCKLTDQRRSNRKWKTIGGKQTKQARRREIRTLLCVTWRRIKRKEEDAWCERTSLKCRRFGFDGSAGGDGDDDDGFSSSFLAYFSPPNSTVVVFLLLLYLCSFQFGRRRREKLQKEE